MTDSSTKIRLKHKVPLACLDPEYLTANTVAATSSDWLICPDWSDPCSDWQLVLQLYTVTFHKLFKLKQFETYEGMCVCVTGGHVTCAR